MKEIYRIITINFLIASFLLSTVHPIVLSMDSSTIEGFDKGPSYNPVVPLKKMMMVGYDEKTYLDMNGHMPFGVDSYPHEKEPTLFGNYLIPFIALISIIVLLIIAILLPNKK